MFYRNRRKIVSLLCVLIACFYVYKSSSTAVKAVPQHMPDAKDILKINGFQGSENCSSQMKVLIIVTSSPSNFEARKVFREIYLPLLSDWRMIFFIGKSTKMVNEAIEDEAKHNGDIIQANFIESYSNLTIKSLLLLKWIEENCLKPHYVLKLDDDIYINLDNMEKLIACLDMILSNSHEFEPIPQCKRWENDPVGYFIDSIDGIMPYVAGGYLYKNISPDRRVSSKWYISEETYAPSVFPNYLSGTSYLLTTNIIPLILQAAYKVPVIHLEDVYITGLLLSKELSMHLTHIDGWYRYRPTFDDACLYQEAITFHGYLPHELRNVHNTVTNSKLVHCHGWKLLRQKIISILSDIFPKVKI